MVQYQATCHVCGIPARRFGLESIEQVTCPEHRVRVAATLCQDCGKALSKKSSRRCLKCQGLSIRKGPRVCEIVGCEKPLRAKGYCSTHYGQFVNRYEFPRVTVPCTHCGTPVDKDAGQVKRYKPFCGYACRDAYRQMHPNGQDSFAKCNLPHDHPVRQILRQRAATRREAARAALQIPKPRFIAGSCGLCGEPFVADRKAFHSNAKYCSPFCMARSSRRDRRLRESGSAIHWTQLVMRDGTSCHICGDPVDPDDYERRGSTFVAGITYPSVDHVVPLAKGGAHDLMNVRLAHMLCNSLKSDAV